MEAVSTPETLVPRGLRYVLDDGSGLRRIRSGSVFRYVDAAGVPICDQETLDRNAALVLPPAWGDVRISPKANGHLQATGRDV